MCPLDGAYLLIGSLATFMLKFLDLIQELLVKVQQRTKLPSISSGTSELTEVHGFHNEAGS